MFFHDLIQSSWSEGEGVMNRCCWRVPYLHFSYLYGSYPSFRLNVVGINSWILKFQNFSEIMWIFFKSKFLSMWLPEPSIFINNFPGFWELDAAGLQQDDSQLFAENCILKGGSFSWGKPLGRCWKWFFWKWLGCCGVSRKKQYLEKWEVFSRVA